MQDFCSDGHPIASIADCRRQHIANFTARTSRRVEITTVEMTATPGGDNFRIRSNELSDLNTRQPAQFEHSIRVGAST